MRALFVLTTLAISGALLGLAGQQAPQRPTASDDEDEAAYEAKVAERQLEENCLICHEDTMITRQRLTPIQWKAEVEKMILWRAPLPAERVNRSPITSRAFTPTGSRFRSPPEWRSRRRDRWSSRLRDCL